MIKKNKTAWSFKPLKGRAKSIAASGVALAGFAGATALVFSPWFVGAALGYGVAKFGMVASIVKIPFLRKWSFNKSIQKGTVSLLSKDHVASKMASEIASQLGRKEAPQIYLVDEAFMKKTMPWYLRLLFKTKIGDDIFDKVFKPHMKVMCAALAGANVLVATQDALDHFGQDEKALRHVLAHEIAHLEAGDSISFNKFSETVTASATKVLFRGGVLLGALGLVGVAVPAITAPFIATAGVSVIAAYGTLAAARFAGIAGNNYASRIVEARADRNALHITQDLDGGLNALELIHFQEGGKKFKGSLREAFNSHPSYQPRKSILRQAWEQVQSHAKMTVKPAMTKLEKTPGF